MVGRPLVQQPASTLGQVLSVEHTAIFDLAEGLGLHLVGDVSESRGLLMQVDHGIHLDDAVFNQTKRPGQLLVFLRTHWREERPRLTSDQQNVTDNLYSSQLFRVLGWVRHFVTTADVRKGFLKIHSID